MTATEDRGPSRDHILIRLADEGVPIAAIARAAQKPFDDVCDILNVAKDAGQIIELPRADWPVGGQRQDRGPARSRPERGSVRDEVLPVRLMVAFGLTPVEADFVAVLVTREFASRIALHNAITAPGADEPPDPKIVDVYACKIRKKLTPRGIEITTVWGRGYRLTAENRAAILRLAGEGQ